jgi:transcriptional regulator with XRE-family HTH domain
MVAAIPAPLSSDTVGGLIRRYRQLAGLTQEELGEKAGLSVRAVRNLEQDKIRRPRHSTLQRIASVLGTGELDPTRPVSDAQVIELPVATVTAADRRVADPRDELYCLQPILAQVAEQFQPEQVLVVQVQIVCPACAAVPEAAPCPAERRAERRRRSGSAEHSAWGRASGAAHGGQHHGS